MTTRRKILIPLPQTDFDPTEVAVPWRALTDAGHEVLFATETGREAACDAVTLTGQGLPLVARSLAAKPANRILYEEMAASEAFRAPLDWSSVNTKDFDAFHFSGGHAPGMKPYLESKTVQQIARHAFAAAKPVSAICHGVIPLARAGVLAGRRTTALTAFQERVAIALTRSHLGDHYRTYPVTVEAEVREALGVSGMFETGPLLPRYATMDRPDIGFVVRDGNYLSARWPGDAWTLATALVALLSPAKL